MKHKLIDDTLNIERDGIWAKCECGWKSGPHVSGMAASAAMMDHKEECADRREHARTPFR